ncbi:MAG: hypothetical protein A3K16_05715 [Omnitrophica bacterium RIFCSPLOWO2_01_FULL_45_24]|nr:MAG: hypothetical protein A3C51_02380 [Omnitrophica bacterium RIFCSPHIGHO2_02_FULL_46_20]OGW95302.1 MAG: hypothetical protein A3K16_05715 [Omnitrophica bacterium RIFCSPLOWO2_01_FULL_45_24]
MRKLLLLPSAKKDIDSLPDHIFKKIKEKLLILKDNSRPSGCIKLTSEEGYRLRSGDYRILYRIDDKERAVYIYKIKHRREAYR